MQSLASRIDENARHNPDGVAFFEGGRALSSAGYARGSNAFAARLLRDAANGHVIVPFWSALQVTIALLALERYGLRRALAQFEVVADESYAGEIMRVLG